MVTCADGPRDTYGCLSCATSCRVVPLQRALANVVPVSWYTDASEREREGGTQKQEEEVEVVGAVATP